MSEPEDPRVGTVVGGRYRVTSRIASGGMGVVYKGERLQLGRAVAIKFLHAAFAARPEIMRRFEIEARAMSRLSHPHCVSVMDYGVEDGGTPYLIMDYVDGSTLRTLLDDRELPPGRALHITRQLLAGLAHAHGQGIIHRDIKPANIMLTEATGTGDHVRILDFGLAKLRDGSGREHDSSLATLAIGTPSYMPPEQARGEQVDARSDVYSTGVLLFELLTGHKPFESDEAHAVIAMHARTPAPKLREVAPDKGFSKALEDVILKAMAKDPELRFASPAEMAEALDATPEAARAREQPASISPSRSSPGEVNRRLAYTKTELGRPSPADLPRRSRWKLGVAVLAFGGLAACAWFAYAQIRGSSSATAVASVDAGVVAVAPVSSSAPAAVAPSTSAASSAAPVAVVAVPDAAPVVVDAAIPDAAIQDAPVLSITANAVEDGGGEVPPSEQREPVAEVKPQTLREDQIDVQPLPDQTPPVAPPKADTVADVEALIAAGKREESIAALVKLRKLNPKSAYIPYLLGGLYFEKLWWSDGISAYTSAIQNNSGYRKRDVLIKNVIRALSSDKTARKAAGLLKAMGGAAVPELRVAAKSDPNGNVRGRAAYLLKTFGHR